MNPRYYNNSISTLFILFILIFTFSHFYSNQKFLNKANHLSKDTSQIKTKAYLHNDQYKNIINTIYSNKGDSLLNLLQDYKTLNLFSLSSIYPTTILNNIHIRIFHKLLILNELTTYNLLCQLKNNDLFSTSFKLFLLKLISPIFLNDNSNKYYILDFLEIVSSLYNDAISDEFITILYTNNTITGSIFYSEILQIYLSNLNYNQSVYNILQLRFIHNLSFIENKYPITLQTIDSLLSFNIKSSLKNILLVYKAKLLRHQSEYDYCISILNSIESLTTHIPIIQSIIQSERAILSISKYNDTLALKYIDKTNNICLLFDAQIINRNKYIKATILTRLKEYHKSNILLREILLSSNSEELNQPYIKMLENYFYSNQNDSINYILKLITNYNIKKNNSFGYIFYKLSTFYSYLHDYNSSLEYLNKAINTIYPGYVSGFLPPSQYPNQYIEWYLEYLIARVILITNVSFNNSNINDSIVQNNYTYIENLLNANIYYSDLSDELHSRDIVNNFYFLGVKYFLHLYNKYKNIVYFDKALNFIDLNKVSTIKNNFKHDTSFISSNLKYQNAILQIDSLKFKLNTTKLLYDQRSILLKKINDIYKELSKDNKYIFNSFYNQNTISLLQIQNWLRSTDFSIITTICDDSCNAIVIYISKDTISYHQTSIAGELVSIYPNPPPLDKDKINSLYCKILDQYTKNDSNFILIMDSNLESIPFHGSNNGHINIIYSLSLQQILNRRPKVDLCLEKGMSILSLINSSKNDYKLPYTYLEGQMIKNKFGLHARIFSGIDASYTNLLNHCDKYDVIHLALHGYSNNENPIELGISFSDGNKNISEMYEFINKYRAKILILNICRSYYGPLYKGVGQVNLTKYMSNIKNAIIISNYDNVSDFEAYNNIYNYLNNCKLSNIARITLL